MRFAAISDVHGNYPALMAVLDDARQQCIDKYLLLGDYVFDMPFSNAVVDAITKLDAIIIAGNKERYLPELERQDRSTWTRDQLALLYATFIAMPERQRRWLGGLPVNIRFTLPSGRRLLMTHRMPGLGLGGRNKFSSTYSYYIDQMDEPFTRAEYKEAYIRHINGQMAESVRSCDADVILYGHNHMQVHGYSGDTLLVDAGSAGQPLDGDNRAAYTILQDDGGEVSVEERRVSYDVEAAIAEAKATAISQSAPIWSELTFRALRTGYEQHAMQLELAAELSRQRGSSVITNAAWAEAFALLDAQKRN